MRFGCAGLALLLLAGCDTGGTGTSGPTGLVRADAAKQKAAADSVATAPDSAFDYRYAYRLPGTRIEGVQEAHARGCDQLGPARCRITAMRYAVGGDNTITAVLTLKLDPAIARAFGKSATEVVTNARGLLTDAEVAGADSVAATGRSDTLATRLRDAQSNAEAALHGAGSDDQRALLTGRLDRIRVALAVIGEVEGGTGPSVATAPVLFTYTSGGAIPGVGGSPDATFDTAGETFLASLAGLLVVLASVGPWLVMLLGGALLLRWILGQTEAAAPAPILPPAPRHDAETNRNVIQRWFARDDTREHETAE